MIRIVVKPDSQNITINLPYNFVGKQVQLIVFTTEETEKHFEQPIMNFASERVLGKDWLTPEEDLAWQDL